LATETRNRPRRILKAEDDDERNASKNVIAALALIQSILGVARALHWFNAGSDLLGQGLLILPLMGMIVFARGALVIGIAVLYIVFAWGVSTRKSWARSLGIVLAVINLLLVLSVVIQGESLARAVFWAIVPVIILWYLLSPAEDPAFNVSPKAK
jgi:hypothetical protein